MSITLIEKSKGVGFPFPRPISLGVLRLILGRLTQEEFARECELDRNTIGHAELHYCINLSTAHIILATVNRLGQKFELPRFELVDLDLNIRQQRETGLRYLRAVYGLSLQAICEQVQVSTASIYKAESGGRISLEKAQAILQAVNRLLNEQRVSPVTLDDLGLKVSFPHRSSASASPERR